MSDDLKKSQLLEVQFDQHSNGSKGKDKDKDPFSSFYNSDDDSDSYSMSYHHSVAQTSGIDMPSFQKNLSVPSSANIRASRARAKTNEKSRGSRRSLLTPVIVPQASKINIAQRSPEKPKEEILIQTDLPGVSPRVEWERSESQRNLRIRTEADVQIYTTQQESKNVKDAKTEEKKTIQFKDENEIMPLTNRVHRTAEQSKSPPGIMKKGGSEISGQKKKPPISSLKRPSFNIEVEASARQEESLSDKWSIPNLDSGSLDLRRQRISVEGVEGLHLIDEHNEDRTVTGDEIIDSSFKSSSMASSIQESPQPKAKKTESLSKSGNQTSRKSKKKTKLGETHAVVTGSGDQITNMMTLGVPQNFQFRKMLTSVDDTKQEQSLELSSKNSKGSGKKTASNQASPQKNKEVSRFDRSVASFHTFAPKPNFEDYNMKLNIVEQENVLELEFVGKKVYSKNDFDKYSSLKSVLKPRMINLIKQGRYHDQEQNMAVDQAKQQLNLSEPQCSDSDSVYSHVRQNYLQTDESLAIEMRQDRQNYHMKDDDSLDMSQYPHTRRSMPTLIRDNFCLRAMSEENGELKKNDHASAIRAGFSSFQLPIPGFANIGQSIDGAGKSPKELLPSKKSSPTRRKKIVRKDTKQTKQKKTQDLSFNIRNEISLSDDEDNGDLLIEGVFLYYFREKPYFICHRRKIYGYTPSAFNKLGFDNLVRQFSIWVVEWPWFDRFIIFMIIVNSLGLGMLDYKYTNLMTDNPKMVMEMPRTNKLMEQTELLFTICFCVEMIIKMIAKGLILDKNCYLRDYWNWLDAVVVVGSILAYLPNVGNVNILRTFRLFKPLRSLKGLPAMKELVVTLLESVYQLVNIFVLLEFILLLFSILGVQVWRGLTHYRCRTTLTPVGGIWPIVEGNDRVCGGFNMCDEEAGQVCGSLLDPQWRELLAGYQIQPELNNADNNWGITNFDNIGGAYLSMFQSMTLVGWYDLMTQIMNGYNKYITMAFFIIVILICNYLLVNLTLAVMVYNLRKQKEDEISECIDSQVDLQNRIEDRRRLLKLSLKEEKNTLVQSILAGIRKIVSVSTDLTPPPAKRYDYRLIVFFWRLVSNQVYQFCYLALVITYVSILATDSFQQEVETQEYIEPRAIKRHVLLFCNFLFNFDIIIKLLALEIKQFCLDKINFIDLLICILYTSLFIVDQVKTGHFSIAYENLVLSNQYYFFGALRLFRLILVARSFQTIRVLLDCVGFTLSAIGNFLVLLTIFLYVYSLLGMQFFAGRLLFDKVGAKITNFTEFSQLNDSQVPRSNFDNILASLITVFQTLIGEGWNEVYYDCCRGNDKLIASGYFITLIFFGNIIMLNLFMAMLFGNFERATLLSNVIKEQEKLDTITPTTIAPQVQKKIEVQNVIIKSILREPTKFEESSPLNYVTKRRGRLGGNQTPKTTSKTNQVTTKRKDKNTSPNKEAVDSSYDSNQDLEEVRKRYQNKKQEIRPLTNRRVSFAALAEDFSRAITKSNLKNNDVNNSIFNKSFDQPIPEFFEKQFNENQVGLKRSGNLSENVFPEIPSERGRKRSGFVPRIPSHAVFGEKSKEGNRRGRKSRLRRIDSVVGLNLPNYNDLMTLNVTDEIIEENDKGNDVRESSQTEDSYSPSPIHKVNPSENSSSMPVETVTILQTASKRSQLLDSSHFHPEKIKKALSRSMSDVNVEDVGKMRRTGFTFNLPGLTIDTGENPLQKQQDQIKYDTQKRRQKLLDKQAEAEEAEKIQSEAMKKRMSTIIDHMKNSSLFCFHKRSAFRKKMIMLTLKHVNKPLFESLDELVTFYTQRISKKRAERLTTQLQNKILASESSSESEEKEEEEEDDQGINNQENANQQFLNDPNSSGYIEEVLTVQSSPHFSVENLREQASQIKQMQESGHYEDIFVGTALKNKGMFYLSEKQDIKIKFPKWYQLQPNSIFNLVMNLAVVMSSLMLAFDDPFEQPNSLKQQILQGLDILFTILFTLEALIKIIAFGFFKTSLTGKGRKSYIKDPWNRLDFLLVLIQIIYQFKEKISQGSNTLKLILKAMKTLRALRPLRMISRFKGLRVGLNTLVNSAQHIFNVVVLSMIVIIIFSIFGVHMFKGTFYHCVIDGDQKAALYDDRIDTKQDCLDLGYKWENPRQHFDSFSDAIFNLITFMTNEGWVTVMHQATDSRGVDLQPKFDARVYMIAYFIIYMIISHVFLLNLFVAVIIEQFNSMNESLMGYKREKVVGRKWIDIQRLMMKQKLEQKWFVPQAGIQRIFALISLSKYFQFFIYLIILGNVIVLAIPYQGMPDSYSSGLDTASLVFSIIYNLEAFIKLMGLRARYFHEAWNCLDFIIVICTDIGAILDMYTDSGITVIIPVIRALRVARVLKLVRGSTGLKVLLEAISTLFLNIMNIMGLMFLMIFIFAVLGMNLFHGTMYQENYDEYTNFRTFENSLLLLFRCLTGEGWDLIMSDLAYTGTYKGVECVEEQTYEQWQTDGVKGCGGMFAYVYFFTFVVLAQMVFMNLFIAFVLQAYMQANQNNTSLVTIQDYESLTTLWQDYDPKATGMIDPQDLAFFVFELAKPLGRTEEYEDIMAQIMAKNEKETISAATKSTALDYDQRFVIKVERNMILPVSVMIKTLSELSLPIYISSNGHKCHFMDVCTELTKRALIQNGYMGEETFTKNSMLLEEWKEQHDTLKSQVVMEDANSGSYWAGIFIARLIKQMQDRRRYKTKKVESISEFNARKRYSKMLRDKEEKERFEQQIQDLQKNANSVDKKLLKKYRLQRHVQFEFEKPAEEEKLVLIDLDEYKIKPSLDDWKLNIKQSDKSRDVNRSSWWKKQDDTGSTADKLLNWIKINDIRYGIQQEKEMHNRQNFLHSRLGGGRLGAIQIPDHSLSIEDMPIEGQLTPISGQPQSIRALTSSSHQSGRDSSRSDQSRRETYRPLIQVTDLIQSSEDDKPKTILHPSVLSKPLQSRSKQSKIQVHSSNILAENQDLADSEACVSSTENFDLEESKADKDGHLSRVASKIVEEGTQKPRDKKKGYNTSRSQNLNKHEGFLTMNELTNTQPDVESELRKTTDIDQPSLNTVNKKKSSLRASSGVSRGSVHRPKFNDLILESESSQSQMNARSQEEQKSIESQKSLLDGVKNSNSLQNQGSSNAYQQLPDFIRKKISGEIQFLPKSQFNLTAGQDNMSDAVSSRHSVIEPYQDCSKTDQGEQTPVSDENAKKQARTKPSQFYRKSRSNISSKNEDNELLD